MTYYISILGSSIHSTSYAQAVTQILDWASSGESHYVCAANVHMLMEAYDSPEFQKVVNSADLVTPDGMPLVWIMRLRGFKHQERVYGPTLMLKVLTAAQDSNIPVGFLGGTRGTLDSLVKKIRVQYPHLTIAHKFSPPFKELSAGEDRSLTKKINSSGIRILFVGLGCPKQEKWMHTHRGQIPAVMIGVGAAFDFHSGKKRQAPKWMQQTGLEWFFRLVNEPSRLWKRYLIQNPRFVILNLIEHIRYWMGKKN